MIFYQIDAGGDRNFSYLVADKNGGKAGLIDPAPDSDRYLGLIQKHALTVEYAIVTHGHSDHTCGMNETARRFHCKTVGHRLLSREAGHLPVDLPVDDGDSLPLGELTVKILHTPGHTDDSICILCEDKLVTGDTLFVGKVGGTDLGEGARKEYRSLHDKLMTLDPAIEVYPGHDYGTAPTSTIGKEKTTNPFILRDSFEAFLDLKANWLQYKKDHGIK